ncbi:MAG: TatD DNase family protein [Parcubacteria group bacterium Athens0714_25]|nr:MAG: TatD DNase family protein [Parcubacteria group bacterium Athens0714_25]
MIDTHAHLDDKQFDKDREETILRSFESGVEKIINIGADLEGSRASVELAQSHKNIFAAVGLHPHCFSEKEFSIFNFQFSINSQLFNFKFRKNLKQIRKLAKNEKVVAIGEVGLDYFFYEAYGIEHIAKIKQRQKKGFVAQLELAQELDLPVIIHCRSSKENPTDAYDDLYAIISKNLQTEKCKLVMHCYSGNLDFTKKLLQHKNIYFSFTPNITYKTRKNSIGTKDDIVESIKIIPLERIMVETDCPYLAPQEFRGSRSEPAYVKYAVEKIAQIKGIELEEAERITTKNSKIFFSVDNS